MSDSIIPLPDLIDNILNAAGSQRGTDVSDQLRDSLNALTSYPDFSQARLAIASQLPNLKSATGAGLLAIWLGAGVEAGVEPEPTTRPILDAMLRWSKTVCDDSDGQTDESSDQEDETIDGLNLLGQSLVAHLARCPIERSRIANDDDVVEELARVEDVVHGAVWVLEILRQCSGGLVVIHIEKRKGVRVTYKNISNCFHLFTLLQETLTADLQPTRTSADDATPVAGARPDRRDGDSARWHYGRGDVPNGELTSSVWGEASPASIPQINGEQVLLLWPMIVRSRGWDSGFFGPSLSASPSSVNFVDELSNLEVDEWWKRLALPILPKKPKWKFW